jgi:transaldolase
MQAGITDYKAFSPIFVSDRPISLEVFSDEFEDMERQAPDAPARNARVKIPVMNTKRETSYADRKLAARKVKLNITALMTGRRC